MTRPLRRDDGRLDPGRAAVALERQVRAYQPWPGSFIDTNGGRLVVLTASVGDAIGSSARRVRTPRAGDCGPRAAPDRGPAGGRQADALGGVPARPSRDRRQRCASIGPVTDALPARPVRPAHPTRSRPGSPSAASRRTAPARSPTPCGAARPARSPTSGRCRPRCATRSTAAFRFDTVADTELREDADGGLTEKALHRLGDGALIESVLMHYPARRGVARAAHAVHLEPGRLRGRLPVLRHR